MPDSTPRYNIPFDLLRGDSPNGAQMGQDIATAVETALGVVDDRTVTLPAGDGSNSQVLTGADKRCDQSARTVLLTSNFTLTHDQVVRVGAKARFVPDGTSGSSGLVGIMILIDGAAPSPQVNEAGPGSVDIPANITRAHLSIPTFPVLLASGSHTVTLIADRDGNGVINATADSTAISGHTYNPTTLTVEI